MDSRKYIGMDVHQAAVSLAVLDASGKLVIESVIEAKAAVILEFFGWLRGNLWVTFEEGTWAAWLYDLLKPHVAQVVVCNPRKNALLKEGNKSDRVDARKLAELLRAGLLSPVYHGESGVRTLRELARSYLTITEDLIRVMNRIKGLYRSRAIACGGQTVYAPRHRAAWLEKLHEAGIQRRAERLYQPLDQPRLLHPEARRELVSESRKHRVCLGHRVPESTLCPLGQPKKAIGLEPQMESWLASPNRTARCASGLGWSRHELQ